MNTLKLIVMIAGAWLSSLPGSALRAVGLGYRKEYRIGGRDIKRPRCFRTRSHKAAFEDLGRYITNAFTHDLMVAYTDAALTRANPLRPPRVPLHVWHETLAFFAEQGCIETRWELRIPHCSGRPNYLSAVWDPSDPSSFRTPRHDRSGAPITAESSYYPGALTDQQMRALLGERYRLRAAGPPGGEADSAETVTLGAQHFSRIYYRPRSVLSEADTRRAAERLVGALAAARQ